jgi:hypothetical protein
LPALSGVEVSKESVSKNLRYLSCLPLHALGRGACLH